MGETEFHFSPRPNRAHEIRWRGWSEGAFAEAGKLDRPILLSISAVWCHWCHVMDETTYSNSGVIDLINREYVPIRVDNDVRPDINQRYNMGGWPTTAFLTPSGDILTGATYLPADQMADALARVAGYYRTNQPEIANRVLEGRKRAGSGVARSAGTLADGIVDEVVEAVKNAYDPEYGGFGSAPKFPQTDAILLLLEQAQLDADPELRAMATHTLEMMATGGTYDPVEGGFFRYSTTQDWSVPHFEKMLEDHAGLVNALALAGLQEALDTTTGYLDRVLRDPVTGLYAGSQDADERRPTPPMSTAASTRPGTRRWRLPTSMPPLDASGPPCATMLRSCWSAFSKTGTNRPAGSPTPMASPASCPTRFGGSWPRCARTRPGWAVAGSRTLAISPSTLRIATPIPSWAATSIIPAANSLAGSASASSRWSKTRSPRWRLWSWTSWLVIPTSPTRLGRAERSNQWRRYRASTA